MSLVESIKIPLGTVMPVFNLKDPSDKTFDGASLYGARGLLVVFTCNHCPYANAVWPRLIRIARYAMDMHFGVVAINPNIHPKYPDDAPDKMINKVQELNIPFPYLVDAEQSVARAFKAQCTPDVYLFDKDKRLVYHGRIDDNWKDESAVRKEDLMMAIKDVVLGQPLDEKQFPSMGCSIKWREV
jgi:peroxiredoxin